MTTFVPLDKSRHKHTRIITQRGAEYGENIHLVPVVADELNHLILEYPVCFVKSHETGQFGLNALLGFEPGENLYLNENEWRANYLPLHFKRQPFMVSVNGNPNGQPNERPNAKNSVITMNIDSARILETNPSEVQTNVQDQSQELSSEPLFEPNGEPSTYLTEINGLLSALLNGIVRTEKFISTLSEFNLIEPIQLNVTLSNEQQVPSANPQPRYQRSFEGLYTINQTVLQNLNAEQLLHLNQKGYLQACYLILVSMGHVQTLISLKQNKLAMVL